MTAPEFVDRRDAQRGHFERADDARVRDDLAAVLRGHGQADCDPQAGTFDCRCGSYTGPWLSTHQADAVLTFLRRAAS